LTCISFASHHSFQAYVNNQCSDFELISPEYIGYDVIWNILPDQKVDVDTITRASFRKDVLKRGFTTALSYKLRRKSHNSNDQPNADNTKDTSLQLLVIWRSEERLILCVNTMLIKHSDAIIWNEDKLKKLCYKRLSLHKDDHIISDIWLLDDAIALMTTLKCGEEKNTIEIAISEGIRKDDSIEPLWIPSDI
jgi:hypothetical protein